MKIKIQKGDCVVFRCGEYVDLEEGKNSKTDMYTLKFKTIWDYGYLYLDLDMYDDKLFYRPNLELDIMKIYRENKLIWERVEAFEEVMKKLREISRENIELKLQLERLHNRTAHMIQDAIEDEKEYAKPKFNMEDEEEKDRQRRVRNMTDEERYNANYSFYWDCASDMW